MKQQENSTINLPSTTDLALHLIGEELKSRRFFHALQQVGLDDCYFQPDLDSLILKYLGLDDGSDETYNTNFAIMTRRSKKIRADHASITKQALKVYQELMEEKKKRSDQD